MYPFAGIPVLLEPGVVIAPLVIEHNDLSTLADLTQVPEAPGLRGYGPAVHSGPDTIRPSGGLRGSIVKLPDLDPPVVVPKDPVTISAVIPIRLAWERRARPGAKLPFT